jgi:hypothetical protein
MLFIACIAKRFIECARPSRLVGQQHDLERALFPRVSRDSIHNASSLTAPLMVGTCYNTLHKCKGPHFIGHIGQDIQGRHAQDLTVFHRADDPSARVIGQRRETFLATVIRRQYVSCWKCLVQTPRLVVISNGRVRVAVFTDAPRAAMQQ